MMLRFVCMQLVTREEDQWGLRLYFGDRDEVRVSKMHNFDNSDKLVVCFLSTLKSHVYLQQNTEFTQLMCTIVFLLCVKLLRKM